MKEKSSDPLVIDNKKVCPGLATVITVKQSTYFYYQIIVIAIIPSCSIKQQQVLSQCIEPTSQHRLTDFSGIGPLTTLWLSQDSAGEDLPLNSQNQVLARLIFSPDIGQKPYSSSCRLSFRSFPWFLVMNLLKTISHYSSQSAMRRQKKVPTKDVLRPLSNLDSQPMEVTSHHFCCVLFMRNELWNLAPH